MAGGFNWVCPYCEHAVTITGSRHHASSILSEIESEDGTLGVRAEFTTCPNEECKRTSVEVLLGRWGWVASGPLGPGGAASRQEKRFIEVLGKWRLKPWGRARAFPDYVPAAIRSDYEEAHSIVDLSPKAAATLARRAVQGVIRDYWKVIKRTLKDELDALEKMVGQEVDPQTWKSLDAVRELGNIGAHPERDINLIVDVEPGEAELLLKVVETLIDDTYIARKKREEHFAEVERLRQKKNAERGQPP
jgi:hypothetical protein